MTWRAADIIAWTGRFRDQNRFPGPAPAGAAPGSAARRKYRQCGQCDRAGDPRRESGGLGMSKSAREKEHGRRCSPVARFRIDGEHLSALDYCDGCAGAGCFRHAGFLGLCDRRDPVDRCCDYRSGTRPQRHHCRDRHELCRPPFVIDLLISRPGQWRCPLCWCRPRPSLEPRPRHAAVRPFISQQRGQVLR